MPRTVTPVLLPLVVLLAACGPSGGGGSSDAGSDGPTDTEYFGLATGTCYRLVGGLAGAQEMTVGVEEESDVLGYTTRQIRYRLGGVLRLTDYVTLEDGKVLIHRREVRGLSGSGYEVEFDPPVVWLERPIRDTGTSPIATSTTATDVTTLDTSAWDVEVSVAAPESLVVPQQSEPYESNPVYVHYQNDAGLNEQDRLWVVPETGFLRFDLSGDDWPDMSLESKWQMQEGATSCTTGP